jgi:two-component system sensor histidine kinase/response regulator
LEDMDTQVDETPNQGSASSSSAEDSQVLKVLLVDDQIIVVEAVRRLLAERADIEFHFCLDPTKAVDTAIQVKPLVILQDLVMPGMNGIELTQKMRATPETARIPIIILSTKEEAITKSRAFEVGADDYLIKLPDKIELIARICGHARSYRNLLRYDEILAGLRGSEQRLQESNAALQSLNQAFLKAKEEEEQSRLEAERANRAKSDFLANMSHEIRTPMNAILGMTHLALQTQLNDKQHNYLSKIDIAARNLLTIINDILDFSKVESGMLQLEQTNFSLEGVVHNIAEMFAFKADEKELELQFLWMPDVPSALIGDPLRLGQVLINLVSNALKFTEKGEIEVKVEKVDDGSPQNGAGIVEEEGQQITLQFSIRDTGIGLTPEQCNNLFRAFSQADTSITRRYGGTGLGLAICQRLVELMGGRIWVESEAGVGSTFKFTTTVLCQKSKPVATKEELNELKGLRVLVVDDNTMSREILCAMLESFDFQCTLAESGKQSLKLLQNNPEAFDLILMDWQMPGMNGIETVRRIHNTVPRSQVPPVLMISAYGREELVNQAKEVGILGFLIKPVTQSLLFDTIVQIMGKGGRQVHSSPRSGNFVGAQPQLVQQLAGKRILLVEDNDINQEVAKGILEGVGIAVTITNNGEEGVAALRASLESGLTFDAVLMDCQMPVLDGYEATRLLRRDGSFATLPIIAMTANAMSGDREKCLEAGMNDHVTKPIRVDELFATLARWTKGPDTDNAPLANREAATEDLDTENAGWAADLALPDVDIEAGLSHVSHDQGLYRRILSKFREGQAKSVGEIRYAHQAGNQELALRLAHTLKGVAGTIGAQRLFKAAQDVEQSIKEGRTQQVEAQLSKVDELLSPLVAAIERLDDSAMSTAEPASTGPSLSIEEISEWMGELESHLFRDDTRASEVLVALHPFFSDTVCAESFRAVERAVGQYDFRAAIQHLPSLKECLLEYKGLEAKT